jgi:LAO/AO transport system kinase
MQELADWRRETGHFAARRAAQARFWFEAEVREGLLARLRSESAREAMSRLGRAVSDGELTPSEAARQMLERHLAP